MSKLKGHSKTRKQENTKTIHDFSMTDILSYNKKKKLGIQQSLQRANV